MAASVIMYLDINRTLCCGVFGLDMNIHIFTFITDLQRKQQRLRKVHLFRPRICAEYFISHQRKLRQAKCLLFNLTCFDVLIFCISFYWPRSTISSLGFGSRIHLPLTKIFPEFFNFPVPNDIFFSTIDHLITSLLCYCSSVR